MYDATPMDTSSCPLDYRYAPTDFRVLAPQAVDVAYVIGGLYGNVEALDSILRMAEAERRAGHEVTLLFNGDFNWFNVAPADFRAVNGEVLRHAAIAGNVEAELERESEQPDCGCNYPAYVDPGVAARSNEIFGQLKGTALGCPDVRRALAALPRIAALQVGGVRVGVVHGDAQSLAGWGFAAEALPGGMGDKAWGDAGCAAPDTAAGERTSPEALAALFGAADVDVFACSHTCLPVALNLDVAGRERLLINNGAAGMPNFAGDRRGVLTRIAAGPRPPESLYGYDMGGVRCDALPIPYDHDAWLARFLRQWPVGSPAHTSYCGRLLHGPAWRPAQAMRGNVR